MKQELIDVSLIEPNEGQIDGVPSNPRTISKDKMEALKRSIQNLPDMLSMRELLVYHLNNKYIVLGGNMRYRACQSLGYDKLPCKVIPQNTPAKKLRAIVIQDNNQFGETDWDMLANEWDSGELTDWGFDVWQEPKGNDLESHEKETGEGTQSENDFSNMMLGDRIYESNNEFDIPNLRMDEQANSGLLLPFSAWGADTRLKKDIQTYHFYVEDYRFEAIWKDPTIVLNSGCDSVVEPNLSLFDTTPVAYGLQQIYKKRWIARYFQECGIKVYADLNVAQKFYKYNRLGVPDGYNAFATRGYADRQEYLKMEIQIAREISGKDTPNMIVYGGGEKIKELCVQNSVLYVEQFMANRVKKEVKNG